MRCFVFQLQSVLFCFISFFCFLVWFLELQMKTFRYRDILIFNTSYYCQMHGVSAARFNFEYCIIRIFGHAMDAFDNAVLHRSWEF